MSLKNTLHQKFMSIVAPYRKVPHKSTLLKDGKITPEEFVAAGDSLISICPNWSWQPADEKRAMDFLPSDKQYLINRKVVCRSRAADFSELMEKETDVPEFDGWVQSGEAAIEKVVDLDDDADDEVVDLDDIDMDSLAPDVGNEPVTKDRLYDIMIVYDRYYNVPHVFLLGTDSTGKPLTLTEMYQDMSAQHVEKTVTYEENNPFFSGKWLSIHPCQHGHVMVRLVERLDKPDDFCAPMYFFLFLKFIHTIIPTIDVSTPPVEIGSEE